jgi:hypothetical protein
MWRTAWAGWGTGTTPQPNTTPANQPTILRSLECWPASAPPLRWRTPPPNTAALHWHPGRSVWALARRRGVAEDIAGPGPGRIAVGWGERRFGRTVSRQGRVMVGPRNGRGEAAGRRATLGSRMAQAWPAGPRGASHTLSRRGTAATRLQPCARALHPWLHARRSCTCAARAHH